jgi:hypothetical protein
MYLCYIDESGGFEAVGSNPSATPLMVIAGLVVEQRRVSALTERYLATKHRYFPSWGSVRPQLEDILKEIKGKDLRSKMRSTSRSSRRHALGFLSEVVRVLDGQHVRLIGRVWIKGAGQGLKPDATYTYAIQEIARHFEHFLAERNVKGLVVCDSRMANQNILVSHSLFTQKMSRKGDAYPSIAEVPVFGHSDNHAGLQLADLVASALLFPMAARTYCVGHCTGTHVDPHYDAVKTMFGAKCGKMEYRYLDTAGRSTGGITVSDKLNRRPSAALFK